MEHLLGKLEKHFQKNKIFSYLNQGLPKNQVIDFFHSKLHDSCTIDPDLIKLYEWRNGIDESIFLNDDIYAQDCWLWENRAFLSLEYGWNISNEDKIDGIYSPSIFTPFASLLADRLFIDISSYTKIGYTPVFLYCIEPEFAETDFKIKIYDNIEVMVKTILNCFEEEAYFYDVNGELDVNFDISYEISKRLNPNSEHWFIEW